ncbi:putative serine/threonine protein kinase [Candidatus Moduliflexus flocculans]|uniref:Putative serine/threonine protein kinase n=1 Tax=Candidatus Moduliflexus flocculans TaxID=1499966 RepID=A0A0S6W0R4_9BACT|nr:putative serine/threonine protein kinase [Candidatus Moduliflexus flocculans]
MVIETLFAIFVGETLKNFYGQKATDAVLQTWKNYTQGNHDVQRALQQAFCKTPTAIGLGLVQDDWWTRQMQFTPPKLIREFAETIQTRYIKPFCGNDRTKAEELNVIGKEQCKALDQFFKTFSFRDVPTEDVANLLYNLRFVTDADIMRRQRELTKDTLRKALEQTKQFAPIFLDALFFSTQGSGMLYDGVVFYFEEEIKSNERVKNVLAHFDRQQLLANTERAKQEFSKLQQQISGLETKLDELKQARKFSDMTPIAEKLDKMERRSQQYEIALKRSEQNAAAWQRVESDLHGIRQSFGLISAELSERFAEFQVWLNAEFIKIGTAIKDDGDKTRTLLDERAKEIMQSVSDELRRVFGAHAEPIKVQAKDFLAKDFSVWDCYEQLEHLGSGGMAEVYKVRKCHTDGIAVLKVLSPKHQNNTNIIARFLAEGKIMGRLGQAGGRQFAQVFDMGRSKDGDFFIEMEFIRGRTLHDVLNEQGAFTPLEALRLLRQLAAALHHAHAQKIIHRDIKPQNIIVHDGQLTLIDFGIAKRMEDNTITTQKGEFYGTWLYAAPEQFVTAFGKICECTDVYGFGILAYHLLTNTLPFSGETMESMHGHCYVPLPALPKIIPAEIAAIVKKCTQKQQRDRYQNMIEVGEAIDAILQRNAIEAYKTLFGSFQTDLQISPQEREILESQRKQLGLSKETAEQIERELQDAAKPIGDKIIDTWEIVKTTGYQWLPKWATQSSSAAKDGEQANKSETAQAKESSSGTSGWFSKLVPQSSSTVAANKKPDEPNAEQAEETISANSGKHE